MHAFVRLRTVLKMACTERYKEHPKFATKGREGKWDPGA